MLICWNLHEKKLVKSHQVTFFGGFQPFGITVLHRGRRRQRRHRRRHGHHRVLRHRRRLRTWSKISPTAIKRIWSFDEH